MAQFRRSFSDPWDTAQERYELEGIAGEGSFGKVAVATLKPRERGGAAAQAVIKVAIKRCLGTFDSERMPRGALNAYRELRVLRCLAASQHVVTLCDAFASASDLFLVFELAERGTLEDFIGMVEFPATDIRLGQITSLVSQLIEGIVHIHSANVIHRDIKPANILLFSEPGLILKVCDFGMARVVPAARINQHSNFEDAFESSLTSAEEVTVARSAVESLENLPAGQPQMGRQLTASVVTPHYRSPEVYLGTEYDSAVDMWSAGCVIAELLGALVSPPGGRSALFKTTEEEGAGSFLPGCNPFESPPGSSSSSTPGAGFLPLSDVLVAGHVKSILEVLGSPDVPAGDIRGYVKSAVAESNADISLDASFSSAPDALAGLLKLLLRLHPKRRLTAWEASAHLGQAAIVCKLHTSVLAEDFDVPPGLSRSAIQSDADERGFFEEQNEWCKARVEEILSEYEINAETEKTPGEDAPPAASRRNQSSTALRGSPKAPTGSVAPSAFPVSPR